MTITFKTAKFKEGTTPVIVATVQRPLEAAHHHFTVSTVDVTSASFKAVVTRVDPPNPRIDQDFGWCYVDLVLQYMAYGDDAGGDDGDNGELDTLDEASQKLDDQQDKEVGTQADQATESAAKAESSAKPLSGGEGEGGTSGNNGPELEEQPEMPAGFATMRNALDWVKDEVTQWTEHEKPEAKAEYKKPEMVDFNTAFEEAQEKADKWATAYEISIDNETNSNTDERTYLQRAHNINENVLAPEQQQQQER